MESVAKPVTAARASNTRVNWPGERLGGTLMAWSECGTLPLATSPMAKRRCTACEAIEAATLMACSWRAGMMPRQACSKEATFKNTTNCWVMAGSWTRTSSSPCRAEAFQCTSRMLSWG